MTKKGLEVVMRKLLERLGLRLVISGCDKCRGSGYWQDGGGCAECDGAGEIYELKERE